MSAIPSLSRITAAVGLACLMVAAALPAQAGGNVTPAFPQNFTPPADASLGKPVIGFGANGKAKRTPVIFLHGNDETPDGTGCARTKVSMLAFAQFLADNGYSPAELWGLGYQGDQCDKTWVSSGWTSAEVHLSATEAHTVSANVPDLRAFVDSVMRYTGSRSVDIIAHGMGAVLAREWVRQDKAGGLVRRFVSIDAPNNGTLMCSAVTGNPWAMAYNGGYTPDSPLCQELGSPNTPFLQTLTSANDSYRISPSNTLVIRNGDSSYPYMPWNDGYVAGVWTDASPSGYDSVGKLVDFTGSASVKGGSELTLTGQHAYAPPNDLYGAMQGPAHAGIAMSPVTWQAALDFLMKRK